MKFIKANRIALDGTPRIAASHLGLFCLPMSHKKNTRLIWIKLISTSKIGGASFVPSIMNIKHKMTTKFVYLRFKSPFNQSPVLFHKVKQIVYQVAS